MPKECPECGCSWDYEDDAFALRSLGYSHIDNSIAIEDLACQCGKIAQCIQKFDRLESGDSDNLHYETVSEDQGCPDCGGNLILDQDRCPIDEYEPLDDLFAWLKYIECGETFIGVYIYTEDYPKTTEKIHEEPETKDLLEKWAEQTVDQWERLNDEGRKEDATSFLRGSLRQMHPINEFSNADKEKATKMVEDGFKKK